MNKKSQTKSVGKSSNRKRNARLALAALIILPVLILLYVFSTYPKTYPSIELAQENCTEVYLVRDDGFFTDTFKIDDTNKDSFANNPREEDVFVCGADQVAKYKKAEDGSFNSIFILFTLAPVYIIALVIALYESARKPKATTKVKKKP